MNKKILLLTGTMLFLLFSQLANAQIVYENEMGFSANPVINGTFFKVQNVPTSMRKNDTEYKDSILKGHKTMPSVNGNIFIKWRVNRNTNMQMGISYWTMGFRHIINVSFKDTVHPEAGYLKDLTGVEQSVLLNTRYRYLTIPVTILGKIPTNFKKKHKLGMEWATGLAFQFLLDHNIYIKPQGFSFRTFDNKLVNEFTVSKNKTLYKPSPVNVSVFLGIRLNHSFSEQTMIYVQPTFVKALLSAGSGFEKHSLYAAGLEVGLHWKMKKVAKSN